MKGVLYGIPGPFNVKDRDKVKALVVEESKKYLKWLVIGLVNKMEKNYKNIHSYFVGVFLVLIWGFYRSYLYYFPTFEGGYWGGESYNYVQHSHGALMLTWILFLIIQPLLTITSIFLILPQQVILLYLYLLH